MAKSKTQPQFLQTLVPGFDTQLTIPEDFFSKYVEGRSVAELRSDESERTWKVNLTDQRFTDGWEEFVVANGFQIGDVVVVRYEGDLVFHVSDLGPNYSEIQDNEGQSLSKKRLHSRTQVELSSKDGDGDDEDNIELHREKKAKTNSLEQEASSSSLENSSFRRQRDSSEASRRVSVATELSEEENIARESNEDACSSLDSLIEIENNNYGLKRRGYSSYSPTHKQFVTFTLPPDYFRLKKLCLPRPFLRENDINKPGEMYLLGKDGRKWLTSLLLDKKGTMALGNGWKDFVKAYGLQTGFTLKLIWEENTPVLSLCSVESSSDRGQEEFPKAVEKQSLFIDRSNRGKISNSESNKEENMSWERKRNHLERRDSTPSCHKQFVTLTITPSSVKRSKLNLSKIFTRANGIDKPGVITLLGKDGKKHQTSLLLDKSDGRLSLGWGWKDFVRYNGLKTGDSFTLKLIWEDKTPVLSLCSAECSSIPMEPNSCIKDEDRKEDKNKEERENSHLRWRDSTAPRLNRFMTIRITPNKLKENRLRLPMQFARENSMNKPGIIYLLGKDGTRWLGNLVREGNDQMTVEKCWKEFAKANEFELGESCTLELIWEGATPVLRLSRTEFSSAKANKKEPISTSQTIENRFVTLALTPEDAKACKLQLPVQFMKANDINKLGKMTLLGENGMEWSGYLLTRHGFVALGNGWEGYCEANGVMLGESFTLEFISEQDTTPILKFSASETKHKTVS